MHDGITYLFDQATECNVSNKPQTGNWKRISAQKSGNTITEKVFMLSLDHGTKPALASYAYAVIPGMDVKDIHGYLKKSPYLVASNTPEIQAIFYPADEALGVVFHEAALFKWKKWLIETNRPCTCRFARIKDHGKWPFPIPRQNQKQ